jgi:bifunctional non-homologous end joining protein LigD
MGRPAMTQLDTYRRKRDFASTPEPRGELYKTDNRRFVVQKHDARHLHYDLRLEHGGVLLSWAVPKGPSLDPSQRRLAVQTEAHPVEYADFEGTIPAGEYGGGRVLVWDRGNWIPEGDPERDHERGRLRFWLDGEKLRGRWNLVRTKDGKNWLLIKSRDEFARPEPDGAEIVEDRPLSVLSGKSIDELDEAAGSLAEREHPWDQIVLDQVAQSMDAPEASEPSSRHDSPLDITPQLATATEDVPDGPGWLHEIKLDGYRLIADLRQGAIRLQTRGGEDLVEGLPELARALANPAFADCVLDGELCVIGPDGVTSFDRLVRALSEGRTEGLVYSVFDLPFASGKDLRRRTLLERKLALRRLLERADAGPRIRFCEHVVGAGSKIFTRACELGVEGVVSKRVHSIYESRRTRTWLKAKCPRRLAVIVGGFTAPHGSRRHFGALLVGTRDAEGRLHYRGKVGSGFCEESLAQLRPRLEELRVEQPAFVEPPVGSHARGVNWVAPELVVDVEFGELTDKGRLRHARFKGVHDGAVSDPEQAAAGPEHPTEPARSSDSPGAPAVLSTVRLTHPDKLLYPEPALTKRDIADYFMQVAEWMLPHVRERPLSLFRCPEGITGDCFYQKHVMPGLPESVARVPIPESDGGEAVYPAVTDSLGLVGLTQMSALEVHPWSSKVDKLDWPDRLIFDLDPDADLEFARVIEAAIEVRDRLDDLGLHSFVKTTGGKGLHVVAPVQRRREFGPSKRFCQAFAARMAADSPTRYTAVAAKAERRGKVYIDYLRNGRGATSIAPYSPRARPGAPVSTPLRWDELQPDLDPASFGVTTIPARLRALDHDPWLEYFELRQWITKASFRLLGVEL